MGSHGVHWDCIDKRNVNKIPQHIFFSRINPHDRIPRRRVHDRTYKHIKEQTYNKSYIWCRWSSLHDHQHCRRPSSYLNTHNHDTHTHILIYIHHQTDRIEIPAAVRRFVVCLLSLWCVAAWFCALKYVMMIMNMPTSNAHNHHMKHTWSIHESGVYA